MASIALACSARSVVAFGVASSAFLIAATSRFASPMSSDAPATARWRRAVFWWKARSAGRSVAGTEAIDTDSTAKVWGSASGLSLPSTRLLSATV